MSVRTRFAPSPTGYLHVGGARTALFNYLFARKHGGTFVLRVEDTDEARNTQEARDAIFSGMKWLGLDWDEGEGKGGDFGPYNQSERKDHYDRWFEVLREKGRVYEDDGAWRFRFERKPVTMHDLVCGEVTIDYRDESNTPDMVVRRSDGSYVFHFVNVVDDLEMQITHVIRGEDHLMNTPKHLQLFEALGAPAPLYAHIPLILNPNGSKMSKRDLGAAVGDYPKQGFIAPAVVNFIALLGWSPKSEDEIFTLDELVERFSLEAVNRSPARFDPEKCAWVNQQHLRKLGEEGFVQAAQSYFINLDLPQIPSSAIKLAYNKIRLLSEISNYLGGAEPKGKISYHDEGAIQKILKNPVAREHLPLIGEKLKAMPGESIPINYLETYASTESINIGKIMLAVRYSATGETSGPDLASFLTTKNPSITGSHILDFCENFLGSGGSPGIQIEQQNNKRSE